MNTPWTTRIRTGAARLLRRLRGVGTMSPPTAPSEPGGDAHPLSFLPESAPSPARRRLVGVLTGLAAGLALPGRWARRAFASDPPLVPSGTGGSRKVRWGMVIDLDKCSACQACAVACRAENNVPAGDPADAEKDRGIFWMDMLSVTEGEYPDLRTSLIPTPCNHCDNAPCVKVCPVGATYINEEGIVAQIWDRCIGCRYCTTACPYSRRYFNWSEPAWSEVEKNRLNPDVATRPKGVVEKCTFCHHRIRKAREQARREERTLTDADVRTLPACAQSCPAGAIVFGDLNDPESEVARLSRSPRATRMLEELGTHPKVIYLRESKWKE